MPKTPQSFEQQLREAGIYPGWPSKTLATRYPTPPRRLRPLCMRCQEPLDPDAASVDAALCTECAAE